MSFTGQKGFASGHANVEDVPFKIGEQCMPPKKVTMPLNFEMGNPTEALFMEYDFSLESKVLEWVDVQHRLRNEAAAASKARDQAAAQAAAEAAAAQAAAEQAAAEQAAAAHAAAAQAAAAQAAAQKEAEEEKASSVKSSTAAYAGLSNGGILKPTVFSAAASNATTAQANSSTIDLSDFERAQDPFDSLELKVLDDMAELNKVLQVTQPVSQANTEASNDVSQQHPPPRPPPPPKPATAKSLKDVDYPDIDSLGSSDSCVSLTTEGGASAAYYKGPSAGVKVHSNNPTNPFASHTPPLPPIPTASNLIQQPASSSVYTAAASSYTPFAKYNIPQGAQQQPQQQQQQQPQPQPQPQPQNNPWSTYGQNSAAAYVLNRNNNSPSNGLVTAVDVNKYECGFSGGLRSARSTPDIAGLLGEEQHGEKRPLSHTPPPMRNYTPPPVAPKPSAVKQEWRHYQPLRSVSPSSRAPATPPRPAQPPHRPSPTPPRRPAPSLPDPYPQMAAAVQQFVNKITDMGFQRARVARTVEKLGQDNKKVIDHLCAITKLEEKGFPPDLAETALQLFENNGDKAKQFLTLLNQFTEFGFKEEKVRDALIKNNLDEDKTLDCLTAT